MKHDYLTPQSQDSQERTLKPKFAGMQYGGLTFTLNGNLLHNKIEVEDKNETLGYIWVCKNCGKIKFAQEKRCNYLTLAQVLDITLASVKLYPLLKTINSKEYSQDNNDDKYKFTGFMDMLRGMFGENGKPF